MERGLAHDPGNPAGTPDELEFLKGQGPGYHLRIGAVLLAHVRSQQATAAR